MAQNLVNGMVLQFRALTIETVAIQIGINVLHYRVVNVAGGVVQDTHAALRISTGIAAAYKAWAANNVTYRGVGCKIIRPTQFLEVADTTLSGAGTGGANALPLQVSGLVKMTTALAGRHFRGRIYPAFPPANFATADGLLNAAGFTALSNLANAIPIAATVVNGAATAQLQLVVYNRLTFVTTDVVTLTPINDFATQRRRGELGRNNIAPF